MKFNCFLVLALLLFSSSGKSQTITSSQVPPVTELYSFIVNYRADKGSLERFYFIQGSPERRTRLKKFYQDCLSELEKMPFEQLSVNGRVDFILMRRNLNDEIYQLNREELEYNKIVGFVSFADPIYQLEQQRRRGAYLNSSEVAKQLDNIYKATIDGIKKLPQQPNLSRELAYRAESVIKGHQVALKSVFEFYNGYDPQFSWWVKNPYQKVDSILTRYASMVKNKIEASTMPKDDGSGIIGNAIGRDELIRLLQFEMIPYTPEELIDIANKEFAWCDKELLKATKEMGFGDNWSQAQEKVKQSFVAEGQQPTAMLKLYNESVEFLKKNNLLTIPPLAEETWRMSMIPPKQQLISPFFLGGEVLQISYPTDEMSHEDKLMSMRGNNPHFSRATVHHELIAGHHLQGYMNNRNKSYRNYRTPFWTEGWALYWEFILWDMNFPQSPEDRIGMLFWRMHRCARIIFSLNYHLGKWTPQQCIDFLVERVGHERANAEGEVRRSFTANYGPLYQLAYMTGAFQFYALKKELVDTGKFSYKQFHDAILQENSMPVEMIRAILNSQPLPKDFKTNWRFYK